MSTDKLWRGGSSHLSSPTANALSMLVSFKPNHHRDGERLSWTGVEEVEPALMADYLEKGPVTFKVSTAGHNGPQWVPKKAGEGSFRLRVGAQGSLPGSSTPCPRPHLSSFTSKQYENKRKSSSRGLPICGARKSRSQG